MATTEYPRYMTFAPGELEREMRRIGRLPDNAPVLLSSIPSANTGSANGNGSGGGRSKLLKELTVAVTYPDGAGGPCRYERLGPACHRFEYRYEDGALLHRQYVLKPMENTPDAIEQSARDGAVLAFREAILWEKRDRFCRASEPSDGSRTKDPGRFQMTAKVAKEQAGKYCVCQKIGNGVKLLPASALFDTIEEANEAWKRILASITDSGNTGSTSGDNSGGSGKRNYVYVVACCNRLDRCWDTPKYNPLPRSESSKRSEKNEGKEKPDAVVPATINAPAAIGGGSEASG